MNFFITFTLFVLPFTILASPLPQTCNVSQAPAYGGRYIISLQPSFTPAYTSTMTPETQESAARKVADDLHINGKETRITLFDGMTIISAHVSYERACEIERDPRVKGVSPDGIISGGV